jgi:dTDP-4-dehydrorhamnose 3,5-epimerase
MNVRTTSLPGVLVIEPAVHADERGWLVETAHRERFAEIGIGELVQINTVWSKRHVLRGLHYQLTRPQGKLVSVARGAIFDVAVDIRRGSPAFGRWTAAELTAANHHQLWIPPGFAHGFVVLSDDALVVYALTAPFDAADARELRWNDPTLSIGWPVEAPIVSPKDAIASSFATAILPEAP